MIRILIILGCMLLLFALTWSPYIAPQKNLNPEQKQTAKVVPIPIFGGNRLTLPALVEIPSGSFDIGSTDSFYIRKKRTGRNKNRAQIKHRFVMMNTELSAQLAERLIKDKRYHPANCNGDCPAANISWLDAIYIANLLSKEVGLQPCYTIQEEQILWSEHTKCEGYRLPLEEEWEYAAKAGNPFHYAGSNDIQTVTWFNQNSNGPNEIAQKSHNTFGLYDMSGNMWEWCWDGWNKQVNTQEKQRVLRGGSWSSPSDFAKVEHRHSMDYKTRSNNIGVRFVRTIRQR